MGFYPLIQVPDSCQGTSGEHNESCATYQWNALSNHYKLKLSPDSMWTCYVKSTGHQQLICCSEHRRCFSLINCSADGSLLLIPSFLVLVGRLPADAPPQREARPRGGVWVPAVHLSVSRGHLQVAWLTGGRHAAPDARAQVHYHAAGQSDTPSRPTLFWWCLQPLFTLKETFHLLYHVTKVSMDFF